MKTAVILASLAVLSAPLYAASAQDILKKAHKGDVAAMRQIGYMKFQGKGTKQDRKNGLAWLKKAADMGDAQAMYYLGCIYEQGGYVKQNMEEAERYWKEAEENGEKRAAKKLAQLSSTKDKGDAGDSSNRKIAKVNKGNTDDSSNRKIAGVTKIDKLLQEIDELVKTHQPDGENMGRAIGEFYSALEENEDKAIAWLRARPKVKRSVPLLLELYSDVIEDNRIGEEDVDVMLYAFDVGMTDTSVHKLLSYPEDAFAKLESMIKKIYLIDGDKALAALDAHPGEKADEILINLLHESGQSREKAQKDVNVHLRYASIKFAKNSQSDCAYAYRDAYKLDPAKTIEALKKLPLENKITLEVWENLVGEKSMEAALYLGVAYMKGSSGLEVDTSRAERYFDRALDFGSNSQIEALPIEQTLPFWEYLADKKKKRYAALRLAELYLAGGDGIQADEKEAQGYFYWAYMWSPKEAEKYIAKLDADKAEKLKPALKEILLQNEQNKLMCERAYMVDKSLPSGALIGDYKERFDNNLSRANALNFYNPASSDKGNELLNMVNTEMINFGSLFCLYYAAAQHSDVLPAEAEEKIEAIFKDLREYLVYENIHYDDDLRRINKAANKLGKELFGANFGRDAMKKEAAINSFGYVLDMISVQVLRYNKSTSLYKKSNLGALMANLLLDRYGRHFMEWKFKWKVYSLADVIGGDMQLLVNLQKASDSQFRSYRSQLLSALKSKYHPSEAFLQHVSDTLDLLRSNDQLDKYLIANYMSNFRTSTHSFSFWSPSLGQMCGIDL